MHHVARGRARTGIELTLGGQRAVNEQIGNLLKDAMSREVLDRITAVIETHSRLSDRANLVQ